MSTFDNTDKTMLEYAKDYVFNKGYSVIPLIPREKRPIIKWEEFQKRKPTEDELEKWFGKTKNNIGIVAGQISNLSIIDMDGKQAVDFMTIGHDLPITPMVKTGKDYGYHLYCQYNQGLRNFQTRADLPSIDLRSEGGYVVAPPSVHPNGKIYEWVTEVASCSDVPAWFLALVSGPSKATTAFNKDSLIPNSFNINLYNSIFGANRKDNDLYHVANIMSKGRGEPEYIQKVLELLINSWGENDPKWALDKVKSILKRVERREGNLTQEVREWVLSTSGNFLSTEVKSGLHLSTREEEKALSVILGRLVKEEVIEKCGNRNGCFRLVEAQVPETKWWETKVEPIRIHYPFQIEELIYTLPKSIIVVAGTSDSGKTAFNLNFVDKNHEKHKIHYISSEMGPMEMNDRLSKFNYPSTYWPGKFSFYEVSKNFEKEIRPDDVNIIDYLEIEDFTQVAVMIRKIFDRLNKGICVIAIQKKAGTDLGRGGELTMEKARLYVSMDHGKITIKKAKNWKTEVNPNGLFKEFKLVQGHKFMKVTDWNKKI